MSLLPHWKNTYRYGMRATEEPDVICNFHLERGEFFWVSLWGFFTIFLFFFLSTFTHLFIVWIIGDSTSFFWVAGPLLRGDLP